MNEEAIIKQKNSGDNDAEIDLLHILSLLWRKAWIIVLSGILVGAICFCIAAFVITPKYSSSVMIYVNTSSISVGGTSLNLSELNAAQSLVNTYIVILRSRETLTEVATKADVDYTYEELLDMIEAGSVSGTEVFSVTVTGEDPYEAKNIAHAVGLILKERVEAIVNGSSMKIVDSAVASNKKVSPSITKYTAVGLAIGIILSSAILIVADVLDDVIRDDTYILETYSIPILARVPDLMSEESNRYGYYKSYGHNHEKRENQ